MGQDPQQRADRHLGRGRLHHRQPHPTIFYGAKLHPGSCGEIINHYNVLHTVEDHSTFGALQLKAA
ncbi:hypothetical protein [Kitasatospora acidiphila]|uniref:hypothetical protein n=1 Tax=Kitasatospora acidiphila TaxID=2567942 RepID=UPI0015F006B4|nr:hypothetical protein [Kitasatospora acidiphila]